MQDTNGWHNKWNEFMRQDEAFIDWHNMQVFKGELNSLELINEKNTFFQSGGSSQGRALLNSFLKERHKNYFITISRPYESSIYCSRLSPYLAWGALSMRQVVCETLHTTQQSGGNIHLRQFMSRLMWQAHFIQKFERETRMEFENINPMFNGVRLEINESLLQAWKAGETGYPLVDASMRCLHATGWINFRMRAMLVSFLTHHLWQPWQEGASYLASLFLDFEPGIHYPQIQMQAGTTGMHILRIYDPVKQSLEKDSEALFIKKWCPELSEIPAPLVHTPWKLSAMEQVFYNFVPGHTYPNRIVNTSETGVRAQKNLWPIINSNASKDFVNMYFKRHVISPERRRKEYMNKMESSLRLYQTDSETKNK
jgi:deoxyribodipyrimidine photo-lyase